jgi:hypothetical protein
MPLIAVVELRWSPEPSPEERDALERALARILAGREEPRSAWWSAGVAENVLPEEDVTADGEPG